MTSKCGRNKIVAHEAIAECVTDVLTTLWRLLWLLLNRRTATWNLFVLYNKETNYQRKNFFFNIVKHDSKASPALIDKHEKKPFDVIFCLYKWSNLIGCYAYRKNFDWSKKITPLSNLTRALLLVVWKLTAKAKLNCEIYKSWRKCWKNRDSFCHALDISGAEKVSSENLQLQSS